MQAVIALVGLKTALQNVSTRLTAGGQMQPVDIGRIGAKVCLSHQCRPQALSAQVVTQGPFVHSNRHPIIGTAVTGHTAAGIKRHSRRPADRRVAIGSLEPHTTPCQGIDVRCLQEGMSIATQVVGPELIRHDEQDIAHFRHAPIIAIPPCQSGPSYQKAAARRNTNGLLLNLGGHSRFKNRQYSPIRIASWILQTAEQTLHCSGKPCDQRGRLSSGPRPQ